MNSSNHDSVGKINFLHTENRISNKFWYAQAVLIMLSGFISVLLQLFSNGDDWWLHGAWCVIGLIVVSPVFYKTYKSGIAIVFADHRIMLVGAFFLYFIFGASLLAFGSDYARELSLAYYPIRTDDALRVNAINSFGLGIALISATWLNGEWLLGGAKRCALYVAKIPIHLVLLSFLILGLLGYLSTVMRDLGLNDIIVPGSLSHFSMLIILSIFLGAAFDGKMSKVINVISLAMVVILAFIGLLMFNKASLYIPVMAYFSGLAVRKKSSHYMIYGLIMFSLTITALGEIVNYGRSQTYKIGGTFPERIEIVRSYIENPFQSAPQVYSGWSRLSYTVPQVAALDFYDQGNGGDGVRLIPWLFLPRAIFQNKPVITQSGVDFHFKISGSPTSSTGMGLFVSGYYNLGWVGLILASIFCGFYLSQTSALCRYLVKENAILLLPLGCIGLYAAFRIDGEIIADYMGSYIFFLYPLLAMLVIFGIKLQRKYTP